MGGRRALYRWLGVCAMMPLVTVVGSGFLGAGSLTLITVTIFITRFFRPRWMLVAGFFIGAFIGMSVYVTYTRDKTAIRGVVWGGASLSDRVDRILLTVSTVEWFTPSNITHLEYIDDRLNQVSFVGAAVQHLANTKTFLKGETIWNAIIGLIPRAIWRDKPMVAGSGDLVSRLTGLEFAEGTSVGVGPVLELYGNFGRWGVIIGFVLFGTVLGAVDLVAAHALDGRDWQRFGLWFLVGSAFTQLTGSLFEISTSVVGAIVVGRVTNSLLKKRRQRRTVAPVPVLS